MHRHLTLAGYGQFLGVRGECLLVRDGDDEKEFPLNRVRSVQVAKKGVSVSTDAMLKCASRGIRLFVCDYRNQTVACLSGVSQHAVVAVRQAQFQALSTDLPRKLSARIVTGKIRNQRATLLYFGKYHQDHAQAISIAADRLDQLATRARTRSWENFDQWRDMLMGLEGQAAAIYWRALRDVNLFPADFPGRTGRCAEDATNMALNYGYAILTSYIWNAVINAGLEPYAGVYHTPRPGKPSLVLDLMEEYRPWVVDRAVIKRRTALAEKSRLDIKTRKALIGDIHRTFSKRYQFRKRRMRLESILQRQVYHLAGAFVDGKQYRPYLFKW